MAEKFGGLGLVPETDGVMWSVRTGGDTYLVVRTRAGLYDVHRIVGDEVDHIGTAESQSTALEMVDEDHNK